MNHDPANKGRKLPPEVLTDNEVQRLVKACFYRFPSGIRNRTLIVTLYRGGLRVNEPLSF
jgi:site-specific recombinase XerD